MTNVDYATLEVAIAAANCRWGVAEAHGTLCGLTCGIGAAAASRWRDEFADASMQSPLPADVDAVLADVAARSVGQLSGTGFRFQPVLPDEDEALAHRTGELAHWCQGFLFGCATAGMDSIDNVGGDVSEVVADLSELTRAEFAADQSVEEAEEAYAELVEFVRVGVQLVYEEMAAPRSARSADGGKG